MPNIFKHSMLILAIFVGLMMLLIPLHAFANMATSTQPTLNSSTKSNPVDSPEITETVHVTSTNPLLSDDLSFVEATACTLSPPDSAAPAPNVYTNHVYLPIVHSPHFLLLNGRIHLNQNDPTDVRTQGLTVFNTESKGKLEVTLDFNELQFSQTPQCVKWWPVDTPLEPVLTTTNTTYSSKYERYLTIHLTQTLPSNNLIPGIQRIMVQFYNSYSRYTDPMEFTFFYIPNGDFQEKKTLTTTTSWTPSGYHPNETPTVNVNPTEGLQLYVSSDPQNNITSCQEAKIGFVGAAIDLELPSDGDYHLYVEGTVFTQDQNPSNNDSFDAFEILINGKVVDRYSNKDQPIRCSPVINRQVTVDAKIPLSSYAGNTTISLENHRRFDNQFDTYTEIDTIWIDY